MTYYRPIAELKTHVVSNQPPPLENYNLYESDVVLQAAVEREGGSWARQQLMAFGKTLGSDEVLEWGRVANREVPVLKRFDRYGHRVDEVEFHPGWHHMMRLGMEYGVHSVAWTAPAGGHVVHTALEYMLAQVEAGVCCPLTMTYAAGAALNAAPEVAEIWRPRLQSNEYDARCIPGEQKRSCTVGMAMTEKQGGSDIRANSTIAEPLSGDEYALTGHKWFCSAPMSDAFLTIARAPGGLTCFLVPRWTPDGKRNGIRVQRLKNKLGNRSNASSEIEYEGAWARRIGPEGKGVRTIIEMVHHTRLDCTLAAAGIMRQATKQAIHHAQHRSAFGAKLISQPLMMNVLADLSIETEAATTLAFRIARAFDDSEQNPDAASFARLAVAVGKYWVNKRVIGVVGEAMECLGGAGYVEESPMPRLYREAPLNGIWEGSGNVICLDILRTLQRSPESGQLFLAELELAKGCVPAFDRSLATLQTALSSPVQQGQARLLCEQMAAGLQASLLIRFAPTAVFELFCETRLNVAAGMAYGTLPNRASIGELLERAG